MGDTILLRRGTMANLPDLQAGEPGWAEDANQLYIGTGTGSAASAMPIGGYDWCPESFTQASIEAALTAIGTVNKVTLLLRPGAWAISTPLAIPTNVTLKMPPGAYFTFSGTGVVTGLKEAIPNWFGVNTTPGTTNMGPAIVKAFAASDNVSFLNESYLMSSGVTKLANNVKVKFNNATFVNDGVAFLFTFGATADTANYSGLELSGGTFTQNVPATASNLNYIRVCATENFTILNMHMSNISNGGIYVEAGCRRGVIDNITIKGKSGYGTIRGIWLNGSTASDYASELVDISTIARNATAVPVYSVKDVTIQNCNIIVAAYGIYCMNTRGVKILNNYIDVSGVGSTRCIALNNYSPYALVDGNTLISDRACTGILVTQYSHDAIITNNLFDGTFGGNRDIYVQYLGEALIKGNIFRTNTSQQIAINMGGSAIVEGNSFLRPVWLNGGKAVSIMTIDSVVAGTSTYGDTATTLAGLVFRNNIIKKTTQTVSAVANTSNSGNIPGLDAIIVRDNIFYDFDLATGGGDYPLGITAPGSTYKIAYAYAGNFMYPAANAARNRVLIISGTGYTPLRTDVQFGMFSIAVTGGNGTIAGSKLFGANFALSGPSLSTNDIVVSPRTIGGASGTEIAKLVSITDEGGTAYSYDVVKTGTNYVIRLFDAAGAQIALSTVNASIVMLVSDDNT